MKIEYAQQEDGIDVVTRSRPTMLTVKQFCQHHPAFTQGGMRWLLFNRQENGLQCAVASTLSKTDPFMLSKIDPWNAQEIVVSAR